MELRYMGLYFAVLLIIEKRFLLRRLEKSKIINHIYVVVLVIISFVIFNASSMGQAACDLMGMFGLGNVPFLSAETLYYMRSYAVIFLMSILGATPLPKKWTDKMGPVSLLILLVLVTAYLVDGSFNPFLYFRF